GSQGVAGGESGEHSAFGGNRDRSTGRAVHIGGRDRDGDDLRIGATASSRRGGRRGGDQGRRNAQHAERGQTSGSPESRRRRNRACRDAGGWSGAAHSELPQPHDGGRRV